MPWMDKGKGSMPPLHLLPPPITRKANLGDMTTEESALPLTKCSDLESEPYTFPGYNSRDGPGSVVRVGELDLRV